MPRPTFPCCRLAVVLAASCGSVLAAPGDLDPTFGSGGIVLDPMNGNDAQARALAIDASGRIVVAGQVANNAIDDDFGVLRLDAGGNADAAFGSGGRAYASFAAASDDEGYGVAALADGRIVVGGLTFLSDGSGTYPDFAAVRFDASGGVDTGYGNHGNGWMTSGRAGGDFAIAMAAGPAGVVLSGYVDGGGDVDAAALRLDTLGMPLPLFGSAGMVVADADTSSAFAVALRADGSVVLGGHLDGGGAFVQSMDAAGNADPGFAGDGRAEIGALLDRIEDLLVLGDGRVVVAGFVGQDAAIVRLTAAGVPDATFGSGGRYTLTPAAVGATSVRAIALASQPDGSLVAAGIAYVVGEVSMLALRVDANGNADAGFGDGGARVYPLPGNQWATAIALQADGAIVLAGYDTAATGAGGNDRFLVARIEGGAGGGPAPRVVSITDASLLEGDAGSTLMSFALTLSTPSDGSVAVDVATDLGTATPNIDYVPTTATLVFPNGATALAFQVPVNGDTDVETDETFLVRLTNPVNATPGNAQATGTIIDDDDAPPPQGTVQPVPALGASALALLALLMLGGALLVQRRA